MENKKRSHFFVGITGVLFGLCTFSSTPSVAQNAPPISEVVDVRPAKFSQRTEYIFLKVPKHFVGYCIQESGQGTIKAQVFLHTRRNGAWAGQQEVIIQPDGSYVAADGSPLITKNPAEPVNVRFVRTYNCLVPVLTEEQRQSIGLQGRNVYFLGIAPYNFRDIPGDPNETDLVQSNRYRDYQAGRILFNSNFSGGINSYYPGSGLGEVIADPGIYGLNAIYHRLRGTCSTDLLPTDIEALRQLEQDCSIGEIRRHADEASKGVGFTVIGALRAR